MKVTKIEIQKRSPDRRTVFLDGKYAFGAESEILVKFGIREGEEVEEEKLHFAILEEEKAKVKAKVLEWLSVRNRSVKEIEDKLKFKGYEKKIINSVIEDLRGAGILDDNKFAFEWVQHRIKRGYGRGVIYQELVRKGIDKEIIKRVLEEISLEIDEMGLAVEVARKRMKQYARLEPEVARRRLWSLLVRRGFPIDMTSEVVKRFFVMRESAVGEE